MHERFDKTGFLFALGFIVLVVFSVFTAKFYGNFLGEVLFPPAVYVRSESTANVSRGKVEEIQPIKLAFVGDIMLDRGPEMRINKLADGDYKFPFLLIADEISKYDFLFGNLEGPMSDVGQDTGKSISFRFDEKGIDGLKYAGFDALSVANNHAGDWGRAAWEDTVLNLENGGIVPVGHNLDPQIVDVKGIKLALLAFQDFPQVSMQATDENIITALNNARGKADLIIVSFHFGEEYQKKSNARQQYLARLAVDNGASLVIGHHPHVTQETEEYNGAVIDYSVGNFIFDQYFSAETMRGELLEVEIVDKKIATYKTREFKINKDFQPSFVD